MSRRYAGDTLVEVLLSLSLLTLLLLTTWGLANRSTQAGLNARKRVEVVNLMKEQAEVLKAKYAANPQIDLGSGTTVSTSLPTNPCNGLSFTAPNNAQTFHFNDSAARTANRKEVRAADTYVWIQWTNEPTYRDFHIRSCWKTLGGGQDTDSSQFIVRLNK